jgi:glycosyltransferase involved in cell wall biosynthesis
MKVLFVSTSYPTDETDWRGRFTANLLMALSHHRDLSLDIWAPPGKLPNNVRDAALPGEKIWMKKMMSKGGIAHILRTRGMLAADIICLLLLKLRRVYRRSSDSDILHINWLQNALPLFGSKTPTVIGVLGSESKLLAFKGMPFVLRSILKQRKSILAPNAEWMAPELKRLFGDISEIRPIPFGVDQRWYQITRSPVNHRPLRWIAVTRITSKKMGPLLQWGERVFGKRHELHLIGPMQEDMKLPEWVKFHGPASADELCETWFPKAAGLITLSQHDEGRPQVVLEAMAAGLPVVASDIPAHLDVIRHQKTGWIVPSALELKEAITLLSKVEANKAIGDEARRWVEKNIGTWHDCANRYIQAYTDLLEAKK